MWRRHSGAIAKSKLDGQVLYADLVDEVHSARLPYQDQIDKVRYYFCPSIILILFL